jgi:hypothetical protein
MKENYQFEMYSKAGELACRNGIKKIYKKIEGSKRITQYEIECFVVDNVMASINKKHGEVWDTEPYWHIRNLTNKKLIEVGYGFTI